MRIWRRINTLWKLSGIDTSALDGKTTKSTKVLEQMVKIFDTEHETSPPPKRLATIIHVNSPEPEDDTLE